MNVQQLHMFGNKYWDLDKDDELVDFLRHLAALSFDSTTKGALRKAAERIEQLTGD